MEGLPGQVTVISVTSRLSTKNVTTISLALASICGGCIIQIWVRDAGVPPDSLASGIPGNAYVVVEAEQVGTVPAG